MMEALKKQPLVNNQWSPTAPDPVEVSGVGQKEHPVAQLSGPH